MCRKDKQQATATANGAVESKKQLKPAGKAAAGVCCCCHTFWHFVLATQHNGCICVNMLLLLCASGQSAFLVFTTSVSPIFIINM